MAGFRTFATGEVLTAANVNNFLMKQSVMVFADASARTTALGAEVAEGMLTYNEDTAQLEVFDGSAFVPAGAEPPAGIGSNVVQTVKTNTFSTSSATFIDVTDLSVTITPSSASSKILVVVGLFLANNNTNSLSGAQLVRDSTAISVSTGGSSTNSGFFMGQDGSYDAGNGGVINFLDSPATASAVVYKIQIRAFGGVARFNSGFTGANGAVSSITCIEVAA